MSKYDVRFPNGCLLRQCFKSDWNNLQETKTKPLTNISLANPTGSQKEFENLFGRI